MCARVTDAEKRRGKPGLRHFLLSGKVIDTRNLPMAGLLVEAYDDDPWLNPDDFLGKSTTRTDGTFELEFDSSGFASFWEFLEGSPDVYLIVYDDRGREILRTRVQETGKEIQYLIKVSPNVPDPTAKDIYAANTRRLISMLGEVGSLIGLENTLNLDVLANGQLPDEIRIRLEQLTAGFSERVNNFNHFMAALNGMVNSVLEERRLGTIGYDGPQVPRLPRRESYNQVIIWPRMEAFRWG